MVRQAVTRLPETALTKARAGCLSGPIASHLHRLFAASSRPLLSTSSQLSTPTRRCFFLASLLRTCAAHPRAVLTLLVHPPLLAVRVPVCYSALAPPLISMPTSQTDRSTLSFPPLHDMAGLSTARPRRRLLGHRPSRQSSWAPGHVVLASPPANLPPSHPDRGPLTLTNPPCTTCHWPVDPDLRKARPRLPLPPMSADLISCMSTTHAAPASRGGFRAWRRRERRCILFPPPSPTISLRCSLPAL